MSPKFSRSKRQENGDRNVLITINSLLDRFHRCGALREN